MGFMLLPRLSEGLGRLLDQPQPSKLPSESLVTLATTPVEASNAAALSQGPITATIHFTAKSGQLETLTAQLTQALNQARKAPGCHSAHLYLSADEPQQIILFKAWERRIDQDNYLREEQSSGRLAQLLALVEGDPKVEYWEFKTA